MIGLFSFGGGEILLLAMMFFLIPLALVMTVFWIWMLVDAVTNKNLTDIQKLIWVLVILFVHFVGALIYFFVGRTQRTSIA
jgi:Phospholipase_D-nuclease N-terminal